MVTRHLWRDTSHRRARGERGAAAVEFALVLVPFLVMVFGLMQYGLYFWSTQSSASAAREAARHGAVGDQSCAALTAATNNAVYFKTGSVTVTRTYYAASDTTFSTPTTAVVGGNVVIQLTYNSTDLHLPFIPFINGGAVSETAYARVENTSSTNSVAC